MKQGCADSNEKKIWAVLLFAIGNPCGAAGLMGNLYAESGLRPNNLQNSCERRLGMTDDAYTAAVDDGSYSGFVGDSAGYGLAQWTHWSRKQNLLDFAKARNVSIGDLDMQLAFLLQELRGDSAVMKVLRSASSVREASDAVLTRYERPANQSESAKVRRAAYGQKYYDKYATNGKEGETMAYDPQKVIDVARGEVGYLEKAGNANLDDPTANAGSKNYTKYARDLDALGFYNGRKNGVAWCDVFVDWCFTKAYGLEAALQLTCQPIGKSNCGAGCKYSRQYYKNKGRLYDTPQAGDQVFFWPKNGIGGSAVQHTGLVYAVDGSYLYTVEGNTSSASGVVANGGAVAEKKYKLNYARLAGFGRPDYGMTASESVPTPTPNPPATPSYALGARMLQKGDTGDDVAKLQSALVRLGYNLGTFGTCKDGVDGSFGAKTEEAVRSFQKASGLAKDGKYGAKTHAALMAALVVAEREKPQTGNPDSPKSDAPTESVKRRVQVVADSGEVNIRTGNGTNYGRITSANSGTTFEWVATAENGWHAIVVGSQVGWISGKYSKLI